MKMVFMFDFQLIAYAAWTEISEPADSDAVALISVVGVDKALDIVEDKATLSPNEYESFVWPPAEPARHQTSCWQHGAAHTGAVLRLRSTLIGSTA